MSTFLHSIGYFPLTVALPHPHPTCTESLLYSVLVGGGAGHATFIWVTSQYNAFSYKDNCFPYQAQVKTMMDHI